MMKSMGWVEGRGLGSAEQGMTTPSCEQRLFTPLAVNRSAEQGMTTPLVAKKTTANAAVIVNAEQAHSPETARDDPR